MVSAKEYRQATARGRARKAACPAATSAHYDEDANRVVVTMTNGMEISFAPAIVEGLQGAPAEAMRQIEISPSGFGLHFPALDADLYLPALLEDGAGLAGVESRGVLR